MLKLRAVDETELRALVESELRDQASEEDLAYLNNPNMLDRWLSCLRSIRDDIDEQLRVRVAKEEHARIGWVTKRGTEVDYLIIRKENAAWRVKALGFRRHVLRRLASLSGEVQPDLPEVVAAILRHRELTLGADRSPSDYDLELWEMVEPAVAPAVGSSGDRSPRRDRVRSS